MLSPIPIRTLAAGLTVAAAGVLASPAAARQAQSGSGASASKNASTLMMQGPTGEDVLSITRNPPSQVRAGQEVSYTVDVKNVSEFPVQGVTVMETFQSGFEVVSAKPKGMKKDGDRKSGMKKAAAKQPADKKNQFSVNLGTLDAGQTKTGKIPTVAPGDILSWKVTAKATSAEKVRFRVELTSEANPRPVMELEPTTLY